MVQTILALILAVFKSIPYFDKWFSKTPQEKIEEGQAKLDQEQQDLKDSGRPQW